LYAVTILINPFTETAIYNALKIARFSHTEEIVICCTLLFLSKGRFVNRCQEILPNIYETSSHLYQSMAGKTILR